MATQPRTIVPAPLPVVKAHMEVSLEQLKRAQNAATKKHGANSKITESYTDEANNLEKIIANMTEQASS